MSKITKIAWVLSAISSIYLMLAGININWFSYAWQGECMKLILLESLAFAFIFTGIETFGKDEENK